jgi:hypothetical protein
MSRTHVAPSRPTSLDDKHKRLWRVVRPGHVEHVKEHGVEVDLVLVLPISPGRPIDRRTFSFFARNTWPPRVSSHLLLHLPFLVSYWTHEPRYGAELGIAYINQHWPDRVSLTL